MAGSTKMVPTVGVVVIRDGKRVTPEVNKAFAFTADEQKSIEEAHPGALRKPSNEDESVTTAAASAEGSQARAKGGKKQATANVSDEEQEESKED